MCLVRVIFVCVGVCVKTVFVLSFSFLGGGRFQVCDGVIAVAFEWQ